MEHSELNSTLIDTIRAKRNDLIDTCTQVQSLRDDLSGRLDLAPVTRQAIGLDAETEKAARSATDACRRARDYMDLAGDELVKAIYLLGTRC